MYFVQQWPVASKIWIISVLDVMSVRISIITQRSLFFLKYPP